MFIKKYYLLFVVLLLLTSCVSNTPYSTQSRIVKNSKNNMSDFKLKQSNQGKYLYGMIVDKRGKFIKKIKPNESYNKNNYELIKVYKQNSVYPSYNPLDISNHKNSIFRDTTFDELGNLNQGGIRGKVAFSTEFDKEKFLKIATNAMKTMYQNTKLSVKLQTNEKINEERPRIVLDIEHKPQINLKKVKFKINGSSLYPKEKPKIINISPIHQKRIYQLNIPTGKNEVEVYLSSIEGENAKDKSKIENKFTAKPTIHILAIGINEFPNWVKTRYLINAVNDAEYTQSILKNKGEKLFSKNNITIKPYSLTFSQTTKQNIENLIEKIKANVRPNDYFLFYVASHGIVKRNKYYFATSDYSSTELRSNNINEKQISEYLMNIPTIFRIAILDTCNAGKQVSVVKKDMQSLSFARQEGISVLAAAKNGQSANDAYKNTHHGLFTWILAKGLNGDADADGNSKVDSMEIVEYVKNNVSIVSKASVSDIRLLQDAVVLPDPNTTHRRFDLTYLEQENYQGSFHPNVFTPRESQLYINAINQNNSSMMEGLRRNNIRHREGKKSFSLSGNRLTITNIIKALKSSGSVDINILFDTGSSKLKDKELKKLQIIAQALNSNDLENKKIILEGHTDSVGEEYSNILLSQQRADNVSKILSSHLQVNSNRLATIGFGEMYPVASNLTENGKEKNRRVSIFIYD